ncbi:MAG: hypothetical protein GY829_07675 [Gammaproteobacteria bacterium]|nr:hypothetical protein [Gammaproteobacteria bacterium]
MKLLERWPLISAVLISFLIVNVITIFVETSTNFYFDSKAPDFSSINNIPERKQAFFSYVELQLQEVNQPIREAREKLIVIKEKSSLRYADKRFINWLAEKYRITSEKNTYNKEQQMLDELLLRIDKIPSALVLAQAASESAWGTSRFARKANNYFGIWCFKRGCGLVPDQRGKQQLHEVRCFKTVKQSIAYYVKLLNSSDSYTELRKIRATLKQNNKKLSAEALLPGLAKYSERGDDYLNEISSIIRYNKLEEKYPSHAE